MMLGQPETAAELAAEERVLQARSDARERYAPGTRVQHAYSAGDRGEIVKLHTGTLKRPRAVRAWRASVRWDRSGKTTIHAVDLLRPEVTR